MSTVTAPKWTQEEAINYECAIETITALVSIYSAQIAEEKEKATPDGKKIAAMEGDIARLAKEQIALHVTDLDKVARINSEYGAQVKAWFEKNRSGKAE